MPKLLIWLTSSVKKAGRKITTLGDLNEWLRELYEEKKRQEVPSLKNVMKPIENRQEEDERYRGQEHQKLLICAYNASGDSVIMFNSHYKRHRHFSIVDVLCSTMAAPTYFPPYTMQFSIHPETNKPVTDTFVDGGIFANDPEYLAVVAARREKQRPSRIAILALGTGIFPLTWKDTWGGYAGWLSDSGKIINVIMEANGSLIDVLMNDLSAYSNVDRFKLNFTMKEAMALDDPGFVGVFDAFIPEIINGPDFRSWKKFFQEFIYDQGSDQRRP